MSKSVHLYIICSLFAIIVIGCGKVGFPDKDRDPGFFLVNHYVNEDNTYVLLFNEKVDKKIFQKNIKILPDSVDITYHQKEVIFNKIPELVFLSTNISSYMGEKLKRNYFFAPYDKERKYIFLKDIPDSLKLSLFFNNKTKNFKITALIDSSMVSFPFAKSDSVEVKILQDKNNNGKLDDGERYFFKDINEYKEEITVEMVEADFSAPKYLSGNIVNNEMLELRFNKNPQEFFYETVNPQTNFAIIRDKNILKLYSFDSLADSTDYYFLNVKVKSSNDSLTQIDTLKIFSGALKDSKPFEWKNPFNEKQLFYSNPPEIKLEFNKPLNTEKKLEIESIYPIKYKIEKSSINIYFDGKLPYFKDIDLEFRNIASVNDKKIDNIKIKFVVVQ